MEICRKNPHLFTVTVFGAPHVKHLHNGVDHFGQIFFLAEEISSEKCCGKISPDFFTVNMKTYTESKAFNSCLNRKVSVDKDGYIKNCPSMIEFFGHVEDSTFERVLQETTIKKYWNIHKDLIDTCKDCE